MNAIELMEGKYRRMQEVTDKKERDLVHDAANCAMMIIVSESGFIKRLVTMLASIN